MCIWEDEVWWTHYTIFSTRTNQVPRWQKNKTYFAAVIIDGGDCSISLHASASSLSFSSLTLLRELVVESQQPLERPLV